jgi:hypothetical protein
MKLKELAKDIEKQKQKSDCKGEKILSDQTNMAGNRLEGDAMILKSSNQEKLDEMYAAHSICGYEAILQLCGLMGFIDCLNGLMLGWRHLFRQRKMRDSVTMHQHLLRLLFLLRRMTMKKKR